MKTIKELQEQAHNTAVNKGFWEKLCESCQGTGIVSYSTKTSKLRTKKCPTCEGKKVMPLDRNNAELVMLMVTELGEAVEGIRKDDWSNVAEEMADTVIRIMDFCEARGINLQQAILMKMEKNKVREYKHGKKF